MDYCNFIENKVLAFCRQQEMFSPKDKVLLGVSGGADSVCLLTILCALREKLGIELHVAHINHGVRKEAAKDCAYVERLCRELQIPFSFKNIDMNALAAEWKCSLEEAGRNARYAFFEELSEEIASQKVAVAHNMGDSAETVLFHLFRGSGLVGLCGIRGVRGNIVRPLLCLERKDIEEYLHIKGIAFCHDKTNDEDAYTRNRIRHHILPYAETEIVVGATRNIYEASRQIDQTRDFVEQQVEAAWEKLRPVYEKDGIQLSIEHLSELHIVLQKGILRKAVEVLAPGSRDITREHIEGLLSLIQERGNRRIYLPYGLRGERSYETLLIYVGTLYHKEEQEINIEVGELGIEPVSYIYRGREITFSRLQFSGNSQDIPLNKYTKWLDYDKIQGRLKIRTRQNGDYFSIKTGTDEGKKKLKDYFMDMKIPRKEREEVVLIAEEGHVLWLIPYRISEYFKVTDKTKNILQISVREQLGGNHGET